VTFVVFVHGLAFFAMGLAVLLESRRDSALALGHNLRWLAAFGLVHAVADWAEMFLLTYPAGPLREPLTVAYTLALPISSVFLVRFGIGLIGESGPLPERLTFVPVVFFVPLAFLIAYAMIVAVTAQHSEVALDVWSRYLLYFPGNLLAAFGFVRQWRRLPSSTGLRSTARRLLLSAGLAFVFDAVVAGVFVPKAPYGLAPWLNEEALLGFTGVEVEVWRLLSGLAVTFFVIRALNMFETERSQQIAQLQQRALLAHAEARQSAENWTNGLVTISRRIANMGDVDDVLGTIVDAARRLIPSDTASIALWDKSGTRLEMKCYATASGITAMGSIPVSTEHILDPVRACRSSRYPEDARRRAEQWMCPILKRDIQTAAIVPLLLEDRPVGGLWVGRCAADVYSKADLIGLEQLADQAVIALEHASMASRLQSLAVTQERSRIAREMHDGLAQILGFLSLQTQTLEALVKQGDAERTLAELRQARERIKAAQADVRESILSLRTTLSGDVGLIAALQQYVEEFGLQTGIDAELTCDLLEIPRLSPLIETQLVRIVQEALTNVRKHANATHVEVRLTIQGDGLCVTVADDGIGFNGETANRSHFGLQTMRERAEGVGGDLLITSVCGAGTQVELSVPLLERQDFEKEF
jgi:signal transduction histidine kinase